VVAVVHQEQLNAWYNNLAPGLKFPLGPDPVLDPHKAFLKGQYYCILVIINWSFVVRLLTSEPMDNARKEYITKHGKECIESIVMYVHAVERMMMFRQIMLFANFYGYAVLSLSLLGIYRLLIRRSAFIV
jgi:fatty-acid desaturase